MARILIIDDSESALALVSQWLTAAGHESVPLSSGRNALAILREQKIDLVITDIFMPAPDGLEILRAARTARVGTPFIAMSSKAEEFNFFRIARAFGAVSTLQKPFDAQKLQSAVAAALRVGLPANESPKPGASDKAAARR
jgi:CheY-like chemotaxis protein